MVKNHKLKVALLFGGQSAEHEVSLQSAKNIFLALDQQKYQPILIFISKIGEWFFINRSDFLLLNNNSCSSDYQKIGKRIILTPQNRGDILFLDNSRLKIKIDVVFPILHGPFGEDGTIQGLLKLANLPFVGSGVLGSAVGMDKDVMKRLLREAGIPIGKFIVLKSHEKKLTFEEVKDYLGSPFFIKPANMGSSIGVNKIHCKSEYQKGLAMAFKFDTKIIIEQYIKGREVECAVLGNEKPIASIVGEVIPNHEFYSYEAKYLDERGASFRIPAKVSSQMTKNIQTLAIKTFQVLSCEVLGRVDFFITNNDQIIVNEINTIPGFTKISMYPKLWEKSGISYNELIDKLVELTLEKFNQTQKLSRDFYI